MLRLVLSKIFILFCFFSSANIISVKNIEELKEANKNAKPGDTIILKNGNWKDVVIKLTCSGDEKKPIIFKAEKPGMMVICGQSQLKLGGNYIIADGFLFENGYAGSDAVIDFRTDKDHVAYNCRVTNTVINDFNNPKRLAENYWVSFSGKHNRIDHCSFLNKKNLGVLIAVRLDDERSIENFHSIDHNYFGIRPALGSNAGEIIRVGVSEQCQFNSNTSIVGNFFERCDGETEIISIKSCNNIVRNNLFKECQGGVVLRHGNDNIVENNIFLGNDKEGTGGVRIINRGQWVVNNLFYKCRGIDFRSPMSIMNGVPNSPANRYVQVTDAVIANNSFYNCSPISFCEGSDAERSLPPANVQFINNIFYNTKDSSIYNVYDNIRGFHFAGNQVSSLIRSTLEPGFKKTVLSTQKTDVVEIPRATSVAAISDSLENTSHLRLQHDLSASPGFTGPEILKEIQANAYTACGPKWFPKHDDVFSKKPVQVDCYKTEEVYQELERNQFPMTINLTGKSYYFEKPLSIQGDICFSTSNNLIKINSATGIEGVFMVKGKGRLTLKNCNIDGSGTMANSFISTDTSGGVEHYKLFIENCQVSNLSEKKGCHHVFYASKTSYADSVVVKQTIFQNCSTNGFIMNAETDNRGLYSAEKILIENNQFVLHGSQLLNIYRGGTDESTMGPSLLFTQNSIVNDETNKPWLQLTGVQKTNISNNQFSSKDHNQILIVYKDVVRAHHLLARNSLPGKIETNQFVKADKNILK
jgi:poly(beta-D-mannuronate) lyase